MSNYKESQKQLDAIRSKYGCKGDVIFRSAIQNVVEFGSCSLQDKEWYEWTMNDIDSRHDNAEATGKFLWCTRDFEKAIIDCAVELSAINTYDFLVYIQKEVWLSGEVGEPDYQRALEIIKGILSNEEYYREYCVGGDDFAEKMQEYGLTDDEICFFGYEKYVYGEDEEEC